MLDMEYTRSTQLQYFPIFFLILFPWKILPGVLNRGNCTVEMSIQIGHRMASLSLADAEATTEKDVWRELRGFLGAEIPVGWWVGGCLEESANA